jgi:LacI family transcriptional regulator
MIARSRPRARRRTITEVSMAGPTGVARRPVTLTDVAMRAGVSQPTASRVLNGSTRRSSPDVVDRVRKAADELGYTPNAQAQALARASTGLLGLVVHDIADPYFSVVASGVQRAASGRGRQMLLAVSSRDPDTELACVESFVAHRTEMIIVVGSRSASPPALAAAERLAGVAARYRSNGGRLVTIGQSFPDAYAVVPDNRGGSAALADALVTRTGLRDFVMLAGPADLATAVDRTDGFIERLAAHGITPRKVLFGDFTRDGGYAAARRAFAEHLPTRAAPICLVAANDVMAVGAMTAARDAGLAVPDAVRIAGFDDIPTLRDLSPGLTTVRLPLEQMGEWAVQIGMDEPSPQTRVVTGEVVLRDSTGAPPD